MTIGGTLHMLVKRAVVRSRDQVSGLSWSPWITQPSGNKAGP